MEDEPKVNKSNKLILLILCALLLLVCIIIVILIIAMKAPAEQIDETYTPELPTAVNTPIPSISAESAVITVSATAEPSPSPDVTSTPAIEQDVVWINLDYLIIRAYPDFSYEKIGHIPYGKKVTGEIDGLWMHMEYDGVTGYIYVGKLQSTGRPCVVYSEAELQPLS